MSNIGSELSNIIEVSGLTRRVVFELSVQSRCEWLVVIKDVSCQGNT